MPDVRWDYLTIPEVNKAIKEAAEYVAREYNVELEDLQQEGACYVATKSDLHECVSTAEWLLLSYRIRMDLVDLARAERKRQQRNVSYEASFVDEGTYAPRPASIAIRNDTADYDRPLVEALLPAVWSESYCYGIRMENAPDSDMPRGSMNKATGNTLAAHIADIKAGWDKAPLSLTERRCLLLGYGMDWTQEEIGENLGLHKSSVSRAQYAGVGKVVACLNGDYGLMFSLCNEPESVPA